MALRQPSNPKQTTDRHETDYERWLKDHDDYYEPAGKPRYHPSDTDNTNDDDNDVDHTRMNTKSKSQALPSQSENIHVDDDGSVIQVSRYGSVMFPSKHSSGLGHQSSPSTDTPLLGIGQNESMMCCGFSIVFVVVVLLGVAWGFKVHRQQRGQEKDKASRDWVEDEKVC
jgi:hypothetical protein